MGRETCAIIGAGLTGLVAARQLVERGVRVVILDKGRAPGGRASSRDHHPPQPFDHGAHYFTARKEAFAARVQSWRARGVVAAWAPRVGVKAQDGLSEKTTDRAPARFVGVPHMRSLALDLARDLDVRSSVRVSGLAVSEDGLRIESEDTPELSARAVGITAPAPQAAELARGLDPELADRAAAIALAPTWTLLAELDAPLPVPYDLVFVDDGGPLRSAARETSKPGRPAGERWVAHATDAWSRGCLEAERAEVTPRLLEALFSALELAPRPAAALVAHRWRHATPAVPEGTPPCLRSARHRLACAGDWTSAPRVEGAFDAGLALAEVLAEMMDGS